MTDEFIQPLLAWYDENKRILPWRDKHNAYYTWVSEIMLQQTRVEAVKPYFERFIRELPDIPALAVCPEEKLLKLWEGLGYYSRVRNMQLAAREMVEKYNGRLPEDFSLLISLKGIGSYTAGAIASIAYGIPVPAVDGNVFRVVTRMTEDSEDITRPAFRKKTESALQEIIPKDRPGDFNQAMMELGAVVCVPNGQPKCDLCPGRTSRHHGEVSGESTKEAKSGGRANRSGYSGWKLHCDPQAAAERPPCRIIRASKYRRIPEP